MLVRNINNLAYNRKVDIGFSSYPQHGAWPGSVFIHLNQDIFHVGFHTSIDNAKNLLLELKSAIEQVEKNETQTRT